MVRNRLEELQAASSHSPVSEEVEMEPLRKEEKKRKKEREKRKKKGMVRASNSLKFNKH